MFHFIQFLSDRVNMAINLLYHLCILDTMSCWFNSYTNTIIFLHFISGDASDTGKGPELSQVALVRTFLPQSLCAWDIQNKTKRCLINAEQHSVWAYRSASTTSWTVCQKDKEDSKNQRPQETLDRQLTPNSQHIQCMGSDTTIMRRLLSLFLREREIEKWKIVDSRKSSWSHNKLRALFLRIQVGVTTSPSF